MTLDFCTQTTRKIAKVGYEMKIARHIATFCSISMMLVCGLFGLFEREKTPIYRITCTGMHTAGARAGIVSPAFSSIRR